MKHTIEKRTPKGLTDHAALALTTWGVGYIPGAPGTYGSLVGVLIYWGVTVVETNVGLYLLGRDFRGEQIIAFIWAANALLLTVFCLVGVWASGRSVELLGNSDPSEAVVDEVMGQLITLLFIPIGIGWPFVLAGFLLFRFFDIWKPYPIDDLQVLPGGIGVCADDIIAGAYAGACLAVGYAVTLAI